MPLFTPAPTYADPVIVDPATKQSKFNPIWLKWFLDTVQVFNAVGLGVGGTIQHDALAGLQGGAANEFYHLTLAQQTAIAAGVSGTITLAKLTGLGANGSITVQNGIITGFVNPT